MVRLLLLLILSVLSGCQYSGSENPVYFTGQIVNPTSEYVVLYKNDMVVDSAKLDTNNQFVFKLDCVEEGLHHFDHAPQYQYIYLERGDSLKIRLNASPSYFDESLVFSGDNEEVNNFMIEMFLAHEDEENLVYSYFKLPPEEFLIKMDSLKNDKINEFDDLVSSNVGLSEKAKTIARATIDYQDYLYKEKYPFYHKKKTGKSVVNKLDKKFYDYRNELNFNRKDLAYFKPYYDFMKYHIGNVSYFECKDYCEAAHGADKKQLHLNKHKLALIDSLVEEKNLRDNLFRNVAMDYLLKVHTVNEECDNFLKTFDELSGNLKHKEEIADLYRGIRDLQPQQELPDLRLEDIDGNLINIKDIANKDRTVFYFWTADQKRHYKNITKQVKNLKEDYPEINFVGINLRTPRDQWVSIVEESPGDLGSQLYSTEFKEIQSKLIVDNLNKCIISKNSKIEDAFGNLYASFEKPRNPVTNK